MIKQPALVATGAGEQAWYSHVIDFINTTKKYNPHIPMVLVDGGDKPTWSECMLRTALISNKNVYVIWRKNTNCQEAQNEGIKLLMNWVPLANLYVVCDIDVTCNGSLWALAATAKDDFIYGEKFHRSSSYGFEGDFAWIDGWMYAIPKKVWDVVGGFDEKIKGSGFEDLDYCLRAINMGFGLRGTIFPFAHKEAGVKRDINPEYDEIRQWNIDYVRQKHGI